MQSLKCKSLKPVPATKSSIQEKYDFDSESDEVNRAAFGEYSCSSCAPTSPHTTAALPPFNTVNLCISRDTHAHLSAPPTQSSGMCVRWCERAGSYTAHVRCCDPGAHLPRGLPPAQARPSSDLFNIQRVINEWRRKGLRWNNQLQLHVYRG